MNKQKYVEKMLPVGYQFRPSDEQAFKNYLLPKVTGKNAYIDTVDIYQFEPRDLPGFTAETPSFYFTERTKLRPSGSKFSRSVKKDKGFWKRNSKIDQIKDSDGSILGRRNTLVYFLKDEKKKHTKTDYLMVEYVLDDSRCRDSKVNDVVLCKIYHKKQGVADRRARKAEKFSREKEQVEKFNEDQAKVEEIICQQIKTTGKEEKSSNSSCGSTPENFLTRVRDTDIPSSPVIAPAPSHEADK